MSPDLTTYVCAALKLQDKGEIGHDTVTFTLRWATTQVQTVYFNNVLRPETHKSSHMKYSPTDLQT
jgi:hypothetical protein